MVRKHVLQFFFSTNMLNISHVDLAVPNTVLLDMWWNMLIKSSNTFAKIINGYKGEFKTLSNI